MDKITYLAELAEGLARWVPERERRNILDYYAEYFEEAGPDREAEVVAELGDPWALSCRLAAEGGYVTAEQAVSWTPPKRKRWPWALLGTAAVVIVAVSVASAASRFGSVIGQFVRQSTVVDNVREGSVQYGEEVIYLWEGTGYEGFWTMEDGYLEQFDAIDIDVGLANVTVTVADDYTLFISRSANLEGYGLKWEVKGGALKIRDSGSGHVNVSSLGELGELFEGGQWSADVSITVPEALLDKVSIKTGTGNVYLAEVFARKVEVETGLGNVECYGLREVKKLGLRSGTGNVTLGIDELYDGLDIDLESGIGNVEASLGCYEQDCAYELESGIGTVIINGVSRGKEAERKGNASYKLDAESGIGDVGVYFYDSRWQ